MSKKLVPCTELCALIRSTTDETSVVVLNASDYERAKDMLIREARNMQAALNDAGYKTVSLDLSDGSCAKVTCAETEFVCEWRVSSFIYSCTGETKPAYAVVCNYSWDSCAAPITLCESKEQAKEVLKDDFGQEVENDESCGYIFEEKISENGCRAEILNYRACGDVDLTTWELAEVKLEEGKAIYTHDIAAQIIELFDDLLAEHGIKVPSPEDSEREEDNDAALYGSVYGGLLDQVESIVLEALAKKREDNSIVAGEFSGEF